MDAWAEIDAPRSSVAVKVRSQARLVGVTEMDLCQRLPVLLESGSAADPPMAVKSTVTT
jgi:hypothetical protein